MEEEYEYPDMAALTIFNYGEGCLSFRAGIRHCSSFDFGLQTTWRDKLTRGYFRYDISQLETNIVWELYKNRYHVVCQINPYQIADRRRALHEMPGIANFREAHWEEVIYDLVPEHWNTYKVGTEEEISRHSLLINISPIEYCSSILVPMIEELYPQKLTFSALRLAIEVMLLSYDRNLRIAFNSPLGLPEMNHCHFHLYYLDARLHIESCGLKLLAGKCYEFYCYAAEGFVFVLEEKSEIVEITHLVMRLVDLLNAKKIEHNLYITRAHSTKYDPVLSDYTSLRICVWARRSYFDEDEDALYNVGACELAGHVIFKNRREFWRAHPNDVMQPLHDACHEIFLSIKEEVKELYE